jgi:threonine dehydratase
MTHKRGNHLLLWGLCFWALCVKLTKLEKVCFACLARSLTAAVKRTLETETPQLPVRFEDIGTAQYRITSGVEKTQLTYSASLSKITGCSVYLKHDYKQHTGSFKERGALNTLLLLDSEQRRNGVIAASAGNHALALAYHGRRLNIPVTVVMPTIAPITKIQKCKSYGATVHLFGENIAQAKEFAMGLVEQNGYSYINGYDDPRIIAGAGTLGLEVVQQLPDVDAVLVPVGGAGLIAGVSLAIKTLRPQALVYGVEPDACASLTLALREGKPTPFPSRTTLADGLAVPTVGANAFAVSRQYVDKVVTIAEHYIALAVLRLVEEEKTVVEGGGAIGIAPLLAHQVSELRGKKVCVLLCGGNIDTTVLGRVIERGLAADNRLIRVNAAISDRPGGLASFTRIIAEEGGSIKQINHERAFLPEDDDIATVAVTVTIETTGIDHAISLYERLLKEGYRHLRVDIDRTAVSSLLDRLATHHSFAQSFRELYEAQLQRGAVDRDVFRMMLSDCMHQLQVVQEKTRPETVQRACDTLFDLLDGNSDGVVTPDEFGTALKMFIEQRRIPNKE